MANVPNTMESLASGRLDDEERSAVHSIHRLFDVRLRFTARFSHCEAARYKVDLYGVYLSRSVMAFTGQPVVGEGLDGCTGNP
jgi:hypothetical protein